MEVGQTTTQQSEEKDQIFRTATRKRLHFTSNCQKRSDFQDTERFYSTSSSRKRMDLGKWVMLWSGVGSKKASVEVGIITLQPSNVFSSSFSAGFGFGSGSGVFPGDTSKSDAELDSVLFEHRAPSEAAVPEINLLL